jgi:hypothetical protein
LFFSEEKNQKTFFYRPDRAARLASPMHGAIGKSFCFFFQKEALSCSAAGRTGKIHRPAEPPRSVPVLLPTAFSIAACEALEPEP